MTKKFKLQSPFKPSGQQPEAIQRLAENLQAGIAYQTLLGVTGSGKTFTIANAIEQVQRPALVLTPNKTLSAQFYAELREFFPDNAVEYFVSYYDYYQPEAYVPASDTYIEKDAAINKQIEQMRLSATKALLERRDVIIVATVSAIYGLGDPQSYLSMVLHISRGEQIDQRNILRRLAEMQYQRNDDVLERGNYRVLGDVIDIFPADSEKEAVRVQLFDEEIEAIHFFDPLTNKILTDVPRVTIFPKTHYVTPRDRLMKTIEQVRVELRERIADLEKANKLVERQRLMERTQFDIEMIMELGYCSGIENYSRYLSGRNQGEPPPTLLDYLPNDAIMVIDESHVTVPQIGAMYRGDRARKENLVNYGFRLPSALDNRPLKFEEFEQKVMQTLFVSATPSTYEAEHSDEVIELVVRPTGLLDPEIEVRPVATQVDDLLSEAKLRAEKGERVLVTTLTKRMAEDLTEYLAEHQVKVRYLHSDVDTVERVEIIRDLRLGVFDVLVGINLLREGLDLPEVSLVSILDADKEGFLRSERSLIQTIGRAARNLQGKAILYADKITKSMQKAIDETERRRKIQAEFNQQHGITPKGIKKAVYDILEGAREHKAEGGAFGHAQEVAEESVEYLAMTPKELSKTLASMEKEMRQFAKDLQFEKAAQLRDKIEEIRKRAFGTF